MANHKSAIKKSKQDIVRRVRNRSGKTRLRSALKNFRAMLSSGAAEVKEQLPGMVSLIDKSAKHGFIHVNAANRLKANLTRQTTAAVSA